MQKRILFIGHDANHAGAQYLLLHFLNYINTVENIKTLLLLGGKGVLEEEFKKATDVIFWENEIPTPISLKYINKIKKLSKLDTSLGTSQVAKSSVFEKIEAFEPDIIFSNTIANGVILKKLEYLNVPFLIYCHELEKSILTYSTPEILGFQLSNSVHILTGSRSVKENLIEKHFISRSKLKIHNSYINCTAMKADYDSVDRLTVRKELGISPNATIIGGCGLIEWRKGIDIFLSTAQNLLNKSTNDVHFIWVGVKKNTVEYFNLAYDLERMGIEKNVHFIESSVDIIRYTACFDLFFMSSREDPYPLVMIEAGLNKAPTICFEKSGGAVEFVGEQTELVIPYLDVQKAAQVLNDLAQNTEKRKLLGNIFYEKAWQHDIKVQGSKILEVTLKHLKKRPLRTPKSNAIENTRLEQYVRVLSV